MNFIDAYVQRLESNGNTLSESYSNSSKRTLAKKILNSPTRSDVRVNDDEDLYPCIVSDKDKFNKRKFLFMPDTKVNIGDYVYHGEHTHLAIERSVDEHYPQLTTQLCSTTFPIREYGKVNTGKVDNLKRPIIKEQLVYEEDVPCVVEMNSASVSIADTNRPINNLDNKVIITIPYRESISITHDAKFVLFGMEYRIIRIDPSKSIDKVGLLLITGELLWKDGNSAT